MNYRSMRSWLPLIIILVLNVLIVNVFLAPAAPKTITIPYSTFVKDVSSNDVSTITTSSGTIDGTFRHLTGTTATSKTKVKYFTTQLPSFAGGGLETLLQKHNVTINAESTLTPFWEELLLSFGPTLLLVFYGVDMAKKPVPNKMAEPLPQKFDVPSPPPKIPAFKQSDPGIKKVNPSHE